MYLDSDQQTEIAERSQRRKKHIRDYYLRKLDEAEIRLAVAVEELRQAEGEMRRVLEILRS